MQISKRFIFFLFALLSGSGIRAQNLDVRLLRPIFDDRTNFKDHFFKADAQSVEFINILAPVGIFAAGYIHHDGRLERDAAFIAGAYAVSALLTQSAKAIIKRARPFETYPQFFTDRYDGGGYSFPSGHGSAAFCTATSLSLYFRRWYVIFPSYLWASSVAWARMYQGVHYPTDLLAGAVLGAGSAWAGWLIQRSYEKRRANRQIAISLY